MEHVRPLFSQQLLTKWSTKYQRSKDHHVRIILCIYNSPISPKLTKIHKFEVKTFFEKKYLFLEQNNFHFPLRVFGINSSIQWSSTSSHSTYCNPKNTNLETDTFSQSCSLPACVHLRIRKKHKCKYRHRLYTTIYSVIGFTYIKVIFYKN